MFKIAIISDTHGNKEKIDIILDYIKNLNINLCIHSGDYIGDAAYMKDKLDIPVVMVKGNCDNDYCNGSDVEIFNFAGLDIYVAHGHELNPYELEREFSWIAKTYDVDIIITGHTHVHKANYIDDTLVLNPGSPSRPRDGSYGTFAILTGEEYNPKSLDVEFIDMSELTLE